MPEDFDPNSHDYLKARTKHIDREFTVPEGSEDLARCLQELADVASLINVKQSAGVLAIVGILQEQGLLKFGDFAKRAKLIEKKLLSQQAKEQGNAGG